MTMTFAELGFPGRLIAVEGLDGSGKSTQIYLLKRWLELQGLKVFFSEWNSSDLVKAATSKGKKRELLSPTTFSLIHATDFADRYERQLVPLLRAGYLVLCDRYIFTAFARDVVRGCPPEWVRGIYHFAALPDLTFFFKADLEVSLHVGFGGWSSEDAGIGVDEGQVLPLCGGEAALRGRSIFAKDLIHLKIHLGLGPPGGSDECTVSRRPQPIGT